MARYAHNLAFGKEYYILWEMPYLLAHITVHSTQLFLCSPEFLSGWFRNIFPGSTFSHQHALKLHHTFAMLVRINLFLLLVFAGQQSYSQNFEMMMRRKHKSVVFTADTSIVLKICSSHGIGLIDTAAVRLSFDHNKNLLFAERIFAAADLFEYYYFDKNVAILLFYKLPNGDIVEDPVSPSRFFSCFNYYSVFTRAVLDILPQMIP